MLVMHCIAVANANACKPLVHGYFNGLACSSNSLYVLFLETEHTCVIVVGG